MSQIASAMRSKSAPRASSPAEAAVPVAIAAPQMGGRSVSAKSMQDAIEMGFRRLKDDRENRRDHIDYYVGRWYGKRAEARLMRPINMIAQAIHAYLPLIVPQGFRPYLKPMRAGLDGEARKLEALVNNNMREQDAIEEIFEPAVLDALFSPFAAIYTGMEVGNRVIATDAGDVDPGEPFSEHIEFDAMAIDPNAKDVRKALWVAHKYRVPREWLLESPAFAQAKDVIERLPTFEDEEGDNTVTRSEALSTSGADRKDPLFGTIELWNVVINWHGQRFEATVTPRDKGPARWLRFEQYYGPDGGPYDFLIFNKVPANLPGLSPASNIRDIAEFADVLARKALEGGERSKSNLVYEGGAEEDAAAVAESADGAAVKVDNIEKVKVLNLDMVAKDVPEILGIAMKGFQDLAGNPALLSGTAQQTDTLGQEEILNARAGARTTRMGTKVNALICNVIRKWAWYYQTDPAANHAVPVNIPGVGSVSLDYSAANRQGEPADFQYQTRLTSDAGNDPNMQARRLVEFMSVLGQLMPMFLPNPATGQPLLKLRGVVEELAPKYGIDNPDDIINDATLAIERLIADAEADSWLAKANAQAPMLAQPGTQTLAQPEIERVVQAVMQQMQQAQMQQPSMGMAPPMGGAPAAMKPMPGATPRGLRQMNRPVQ